MDELRRSVVERASHIPDLNVRIRESPWHLDYPVWEPMPVDASLVRVHELPENSWLSCIPRNRETTREPRRPARVPVDAAPVSRRHRRPALQWPGAHRSSAGRSFSGGRQTRVGECSPAVLAANRPQSRRRDVRRSGTAEILGRAVLRLPGQLVSLFRDGRAGHRAQLQLQADTESGVVAPQAASPSQGALEHPSRTAPTGAHGRAGQRRFPWRRRIRHSRSDDSHLGSDGELPHRARRLGTARIGS